MSTDRGSEGWHRRFQQLPPGERPPAILSALGAASDAELVWRNELGGQTWRLGDRYLKWSPDAAGIDLCREVDRLRWLHGRHPAPTLLDEGHDGGGRWFVTAALPGTSAVSGRWRDEPETAVRAIAEGLRRLHALDPSDLPEDWTSWASRRPRGLEPSPEPGMRVVVHGDACAPNTLLAPGGAFAAIVDVGDLVLGDPWADLAVASMSLGWNYGPGWEPLFFDAYGVVPDPARLAWFRRLWDAES
ncbi:aminoglycoside 3'-phosphotransferase [Amnibacterium endophyticum]|uniref:Aminoglycoside 3'-phosphotransferase n=1 Tax=Amnibacterium endophyticum TaxID=2109337 RepID=A0ABW4LAR5_9MICO